MATKGVWLLTAIFSMSIGFYLTSCHPQCLDFKPPFDGNQEAPIQFCTQYKDFGCCTSDDDIELKNAYTRLSTELTSRNLRDCNAYMLELTCQKCSPYAAHIYDAEGTGEGRQFPGLCDNYCRRIFRQCKPALQEFMLSINGSEQLLQSLSSEDSFCDRVSVPDIDYCYPELLTNPVLNGDLEVATVNSADCLCVEDFANHLSNPVFMRYPDDDSGRLFVGEQRGIIFVYFMDKTRLQQPFLDISTTVKTGERRGDERGLLGIAFHPQYKQNHRFFLYYYTNEGGPRIRVSEFTESILNPHTANRTSERILLDVNQPYANHNGGEIMFSDEGYLYLFLGDGGGRGDTANNAQNLASLLGKVLRIDVDSNEHPYAIPPDNPFLDRPEVRPEIFAYGVRNIWRCGKDSGDDVTGYGKGRILCGDVGQSSWEEINIIKKGANYGWRASEGPVCFDGAMCGTLGEEEAPIFAYPHSVGKSVTGGHFYRGCDSPNLNGEYIYGDYWVGKLFGLSENQTSGDWTNRQIYMCGPEYCNNGLHSRYPKWILSFAQDYNGEVYILSSESSISVEADASIHKLVDPRRRGNPLSCHPRRKSVDPKPDAPLYTGVGTCLGSLPGLSLTGACLSVMLIRLIP